MRQGAVASCWLVAVMVALAETTPEAIKSLFVDWEHSFRQEAAGLGHRRNFCDFSGVQMSATRFGIYVFIHRVFPSTANVCFEQRGMWLSLLG